MTTAKKRNLGGRPPLDPDGSTQLRVRIPTTLRQRLARRAAATGTTESQTIRDALETYLDTAATGQAGPTSTYRPPTPDEIASDISGGLAENNTSQAIRMLMDGAHRLADPKYQHLTDLTEPSTIGDPRWDALLAGTIRYLFHRNGRVDLPAWT